MNNAIEIAALMRNRLITENRNTSLKDYPYLAKQGAAKPPSSTNINHLGSGEVIQKLFHLVLQ